MLHGAIFLATCLEMLENIIYLQVVVDLLHVTISSCNLHALNQSILGKTDCRADGEWLKKWAEKKRVEKRMF